MIRKAPSQGGFLLVEVLIVILILAVAFTAFMGVMAQALRVSSRAGELTDAVSRYEALLFEIANGLRPDLASYGGRGDLGGGYSYQIEEKRGGEFSSFLNSRLSWNGGGEFLDLEIVVLEAPVQ